MAKFSPYAVAGFLAFALGCATTLAALDKLDATIVAGLATTFAAYFVPSPRQQTVAAGTK